MPDSTADRPVYHVRTKREDRPVIGVESVICNVPASLYVTTSRGERALSMPVLGRLLRQTSENAATLVGEELHHADWVITSDPAVVEERGMHGNPDCERCRAGTDEALRALADGAYEELLVGVLHYAAAPTSATENPFDVDSVAVGIAACRTVDPALMPVLDVPYPPRQVDDTVLPCFVCGVDCYVGPRKRQMVDAGRAVVCCFMCAIKVAGRDADVVDLHPDRPDRPAPETP